MSDAPRVDPQQATEIYRQRYETFRHLDRLRWQMFQIAIAAGSAIYVVDNRTGGPTRLAFLLAGIVIFILAAAMLCRIGHGIKVNDAYLASRHQPRGRRHSNRPWTCIDHDCVCDSIRGRCFLHSWLRRRIRNRGNEHAA